MKTRPATPADAQGLSRVLTPIIEMWGSDRQTDPDFLRERYIENPMRIACTVAVDDNDTILGFQSLQRAEEGNPYDVEPGWGVIGTYVSLDAGRRGIGSALFAATLAAAQEAGLEWIDASIGTDNAHGLAYYESRGFRSYRSRPGVDAKRFRVPALNLS